MKKSEIFLAALVLLVLGMASFFYWSAKKQIWFIDEVCSFESANGFEQAWPSSQVGQWMSGRDVEGFFAANRADFSFKSISDRLYNDHVPLYFWLFRVVSLLFFPGSGSLWIGLSINAFFYLVFLGFLYVLFLKLSEKPAVSCAAALLTGAANRLVLEQATLMRMYMMLLTVEILLLLAAFLILRCAERGRLTLPAFAGLFCASLFGFLTHYDFWIFYAAASSFFCLWIFISALLKGKRGKALFTSKEFSCILAWIGNFALSLFTTILIFPYCRWNLNRGKGQTALHSLFRFSAQKAEHILFGYRRLSASVFGDGLPAWCGLLILFSCIAGGCILLYRGKDFGRLIRLVLCFLTAQAYQLIICFTFPAGAEERYLWAAFTLTLICAVSSFLLIAESAFSRIRAIKKRKIAQAVICSVLTVAVLLVEVSVIDGGRGIAFLSYENKDLNALKEYKDVPWLVYNPMFETSLQGMYSYYDWIIPDRVCFLSDRATPEEIDAIRRLEGQERFIVYAYESDYPQITALLNRELSSGFSGRYLTNSVYLNVYLYERK